MATIGLSKPMYAIYSASGTTVSYSDGGVLAKAVEFSSEISDTEDNNLYADNVIAETDRSFSGGSFTITTDDITQEASAAILGITPSTITISGMTTTTPKELIYDETQVVPYLGFGIIIKKKVSGVLKYRAVVFTKVMFSIPADAATTQGETITWQTPELTATIMRDDSTNHMWKRESTLDTEADAVLYIKDCLDIT